VAATAHASNIATAASFAVGLRIVLACRILGGA